MLNLNSMMYYCIDIKTIFNGDGLSTYTTNTNKYTSICHVIFVFIAIK